MGASSDLGQPFHPWQMNLLKSGDIFIEYFLTTCEALLNILFPSWNKVQISVYYLLIKVIKFVYRCVSLDLESHKESVLQDTIHAWPVMYVYYWWLIGVCFFTFSFIVCVWYCPPQVLAESFMHVSISVMNCRKVTVCGDWKMCPLFDILADSELSGSCTWWLGVRCSSVVRAFDHGAMGHRIDPSWGGPIELFLVPASAPRLG